VNERALGECLAYFFVLRIELQPCFDCGRTRHRYRDNILARRRFEQKRNLLLDLATADVE